MTQASSHMQPPGLLGFLQHRITQVHSASRQYPGHSEAASASLCGSAPTKPPVRTPRANTSFTIPLRKMTSFKMGPQDGFHEE